MIPKASWPDCAFVYVCVGRRWQAAVNALLIAISTLVDFPLSGRFTTIGQPLESHTQITDPIPSSFDFANAAFTINSASSSESVFLFSMIFHPVVLYLIVFSLTVLY